MLDSIPDRNQNPEVLLSAAIPVDGELEVAWQGKVARERFSYAWLRDHCHSKESLHPETLQRQVDTFKIPVDIAPAKLEIADGGRSLHIVWKHEGTVSILPAVFLWDIVQNNGRETSPRRRLWDRAVIGENFPSMNHADIMSSDEGLLRWLSLVEEYGFALASGVPPTNEAT